MLDKFSRTRHIYRRENFHQPRNTIPPHQPQLLPHDTIRTIRTDHDLGMVLAVRGSHDRAAILTLKLKQ